MVQTVLIGIMSNNASIPTKTAMLPRLPRTLRPTGPMLLLNFICQDRPSARAMVLDCQGSFLKDFLASPLVKQSSTVHFVYLRG